ncbi:hypothetical protein ACOMHN_030498 [Nucella lapillus]
MYTGIVLYAPALALQAVVGLQLWMSIILVGVVGTVYTTIGGFKSVIWTDVFQCVIIVIGLTAAIVRGLQRVGGLSRMWDIAADGGRLIFDDVDPAHRHSYWSTVGGGCMFWSCHLFSQSYVQRLCSLPSLRHARWSLVLNLPLHLLFGLGLCLMGVLVYAYFVTTGCDPYAAGHITNKNQVAPYFVLQVLKDAPGMSGLYMAMLFSGTLSSVSSGINGMATVTVEDLLAPRFKSLQDNTLTALAKGLAVVYGLVSLGVAYLMKYMSGPVSQGAITGLVVGACVTMGLAVGSSLHAAPTPSLPPGPLHSCDVMANGSWTPAVGAAWNVTSGVGVTDVADWRDLTSASSDSVVDDDHRSFRLWDMSYLFLSPIGLSVTVITAVIASLLTGSRRESERVDPRLIFPWCRRLYGMTHLAAGTDHTNQDLLTTRDGGSPMADLVLTVHEETDPVFSRARATVH